MARDRAPKPTAAELEILGVLWNLGPATVRQVHESLVGRPTGYTTVLKLMQIMADKGLLRRKEDSRAHVYEPAVPREDTQGQLLADLAEKAFGGSAAALVQRALAMRKSSPEELAAIRALVESQEQGGRR
jgi:BlaI family transcriptional regulator, penicillinase repressor